MKVGDTTNYLEHDPQSIKYIKQNIMLKKKQYVNLLFVLVIFITMVQYSQYPSWESDSLIDCFMKFLANL